MHQPCKDPLERFVEQCRDHNLRVTPQRTAVYEELMSAANHPSAELVYHRVREKLRHISFDTVNRTLLKFAEISLIGTVEGSGEPRRFDPDTSRHDHVICSRCGRIVDLAPPAADDPPVPPEIRRRYLVTNRRVVFRGTCEACQADQEPQGRRTSARIR